MLPIGRGTELAVVAVLLGTAAVYWALPDGDPPRRYPIELEETVLAAPAPAQDSSRQAMLKEAQDNMTFAESDESGGFHNHKYLMSLLQDSNQKALEILQPGK